MTPPLSTIALIPLNQANLCPDLECNTVSNMPRCPVCSSDTIPLHTLVSKKRPEPERFYDGTTTW